MSEAGLTAPDAPQVVHTPWRLLTGLLAAQKHGLIAGVIVGLTWAAAKVSVPTLLRLGIDRGIRGNESLLKWALIIGAVGVVSALSISYRRWLAFRESRTVETRLRERLYNHIVRLHIGFHDRSQTGQLMSRASSDLQQLQQFVVMIPMVISNLFQLIAILVLLITSDPLLALFALVPLPFVNFSARRFNSKIHPAVMAVQVRQAALATVVEESVSGVRVVKGFGAAGVQSGKLGTEADRIRSVSLEAARIRARFLPAIDLLPQIGLIAVLAVGGHRVINGEMTIGQLIQFNSSVLLLIWPMRNIGMMLATGQRAAVALQRIEQVLTTKSEIVEVAEPLRLPEAGSSAGRGSLIFRDVTFGYDAERIVLDGFDIIIPGGSSVALVGATGSGKSTVTRLLLRFYDVQGGGIELDGCDLRSLAIHDLRRAVGVVFEDTLLFHDTVAANIAFADPEAPVERIESAAKLAGAHDFVMALPDGYGTLLGERGFSLSGGQRQRIAIARAILADPRVLVLDDATSAVDPSKEHEIREAMATVMRNRTTIVIAHRPGTIALADTVLLLEDGRVAAQGTHDELLASSPAYRDVLASWASAEDDDLIAGADTDTDEPRSAGAADPHDAGAVSQTAIRANAAVVADDLTVGTHVHEPIGGE